MDRVGTACVAHDRRLIRPASAPSGSGEASLPQCAVGQEARKTLEGHDLYTVLRA